MKTYKKQSINSLLSNFDKQLKSIIQSDLNKLKGEVAKLK